MASLLDLVLQRMHVPVYLAWTAITLHRSGHAKSQLSPVGQPRIGVQISMVHCHGEERVRHELRSAHLLPGRTAAKSNKGGWIIRNETQPLVALQPYECQEHPNPCSARHKKN